MLKRAPKAAAKVPEPVVVVAPPKAMTWRQKMEERKTGGGGGGSGAPGPAISISDDAQFPRLGGAKAAPAAAEPALANNCWRALRSVRITLYASPPPPRTRSWLSTDLPSSS